MFKGLLKFLRDDFVSDFKFLRAWVSGGLKPRKVDWKKEFRDVDWLNIFKSYWLWYLLCIGFFLCGYFIAGVRLNNMCVDYVTNTFIPGNPGLGLDMLFNVS